MIFPVKNNRELEDLKAGDSVLISGTVYTARDAAHKKMDEMIKRGEELPFDVKGNVIYYTGPCPAPENRPIGSCGPTTSSRMDAYTPGLLDLGLSAIIGKGDRNEQVIEAIIRNKKVYFAAAGGAGALMADCVLSCELVAFPELLSEAVYKLEVKDMPVTVAIDCRGNNLYREGRSKYGR